MAVRKRVLYSGNVQGVGFRYTARALAESFDVAGFVRNLPSGDVELVAEGPEDQVEAFLAAVARHMAGYIEGTTVQAEPPTGERAFTIRH
jgi:acylphosphatase